MNYVIEINEGKRIPSHAILFPGKGLKYKGGMYKIDNISILTQENSKAVLGTVGGAALGTLALGPIGLVAGALAGGNRNKTTLIIECQQGPRLIGTVSEAGCIDWARYTTDYMMLVYEFIVMELKRFDTDDILAFPPFPLNWTVAQAEIFWEYEHDNAALIAKDFGAYAGNFYRGKRATDYTVGADSEAQCFASLFRPNKKRVNTTRILG